MSVDDVTSLRFELSQNAVIADIARTLGYGTYEASATFVNAWHMFSVRRLSDINARADARTCLDSMARNPRRVGSTGAHGRARR